MLPTEKLLELQQCRSFVANLVDSISRICELQELMEVASNEHGHHCSYTQNPLGYESAKDCLKAHRRVDLMLNLYLQHSRDEFNALSKQADELRELLFRLAKQ
ncbi:MAG: hypothetical protein F6K24_33400 [Okeania sp. SIO2D1]|nr:hypothetical protein [Okeania sp. SIO2D1]